MSPGLSVDQKTNFYLWHDVKENNKKHTLESSGSGWIYPIKSNKLRNACHLNTI